MKIFLNPEMKFVRYSARDILTASSESEDTEAPTEKKTSGDGSIITPPDEFDD